MKNTSYRIGKYSQDEIIVILQNYEDTLQKLIRQKITQAQAGSKSLNSIADVANNGESTG